MPCYMEGSHPLKKDHGHYQDSITRASRNG